MMKKPLMIVLLALICFSAQAQNPLFTRISDLLKQHYPGLETSGKLIAFNTWSPEDAESRESNLAFDKAYGIYQVAKLRGGPRGVIVVSIARDADNARATEILIADGVRKLHGFVTSDLGDALAGAPKNMVFDANGNEVYRNLEAANVFQNFSALITR